MKEIITLIFLLLNSWKDWKQKEILPVSVLLYGMLGIGYSLWQGRQILDFGIPVAISLLFLVLSIWTREKIGLGDGLFLLALGCMNDTETYIRTLWMGLLLAAGYSTFLLFRKKSRKTEIPFVPFVLLGYVGEHII